MFTYVSCFFLKKQRNEVFVAQQYKKQMQIYTWLIYSCLALGAATWLNGKVCFSSTGSGFQLDLTAFPFQTVSNASLPRSRVAPCNFYEKLIPVGLLTERSTSSTPTHSATQQPMFKQSIYNMYCCFPDFSCCVAEKDKYGI